jgi:GNAT superfamily N-acetyltransferase
MTVHPKHQYRGAGTMMMKWGTDLADEIGAVVCLTESTRSSLLTNIMKSVVEATDAGRWLYEKSGFVVKQHYSVEASGELFRGVAKRLFFMVRPRAGDT